jgi:transposase-like protein
LEALEIKGVDGMGKQSEMGRAERVEIVLRMLRKEEPVVTLARRYGVSETTLHRWREEFVAGGQSAMADGRRGKADPQAAEIVRLEKELAQRDQVIGELTIANRILKKTVGPR